MKPLSEKIFFSYATVAPIGEAAYAAAKDFLDEFHQFGPPEVLYKYDSYIESLAHEAAQLLHCDSSEITYIKNTTEGISIASEAFPLGPSDEILVLANEYPANLLPWMKKQKDGLRVRFIAGTDSVEAFHRLINAIGPQTKAIAISAVQYYDGYAIDLARISRICRDRSIFLLLDAVQRVGIRDIDLRETPVDILVCGGQKYLQAGMGIGFMYVNKNSLNRLREPRVGIRSMDHFDEHGYTLKHSAARYQDGTQNVAGIAALHAALKHVNEVGIEQIERESLERLHQIKEILRTYDIPFIDHGNNQGNIISMRVSDPQDLFTFLRDRSVYIKAIKDVARLSFIRDSKLKDAETLATLVRQWLDAR